MILYEDSAVILFGFCMMMKDSGMHRGGKGRVCITVYICWKFGCVLEFPEGSPSCFVRSTCDILCTGFSFIS